MNIYKKADPLIKFYINNLIKNNLPLPDGRKLNSNISRARLQEEIREIIKEFWKKIKKY